MMRSPVLMTVLLAVALAGSGSAQAGKTSPMPKVDPSDASMGTVFYVNDPVNRNVVTFESQAPLEDMVGTSGQILGYVVFDPAHPDKGVRGQFVVPVSSLDTGIPMRNEHLQGAAWLNAEKHPHIIMDVTGASQVKKVKSTDDFSTWEMQVEGSFTVNGKSRKIQVPATVTHLKESEKTKARMAGDLLAGRASFTVKLADHDIQGMNNLVGTKVGETVDIKVSFTATNQEPEMASN
jgi:polyisoprenoid-binding protein YceI